MEKSTKAQWYTCPMHPEIRERKPGNCPKCGMSLAKEGSKNTMQHEGEHAPSSYTPLYVIISLIVVASLAVTLREGFFTLPTFLNSLMAGFFLVFSGFKLVDLKGFAAGYSTYDLLAKRVYAYGYLYPFIELALGLLYIIGWNQFATNLLTFIIMTFSGVGVAIKLMRHEQFQCACLGTFLKVPLTKITLIEDFGMGLMALYMLLS
jgi:hypothetical protein